MASTVQELSQIVLAIQREQNETTNRLESKLDAIMAALQLQKSAASESQAATKPEQSQESEVNSAIAELE